MFNVKYIDGNEYTVYGVRTDSFLIYQNGLWRWVSMFDCEPVAKIKYRAHHDD